MKDSSSESKTVWVLSNIQLSTAATSSFEAVTPDNSPKYMNEAANTATKRKVCQNARLLFLCTKPRLSQAGALLLPKDFVSLSIRF